MENEVADKDTQISELSEKIQSVTSKTFNSNGTFTAESEGVLGWDEIIINVTATETPEDPEVPEEGGDTSGSTAEITMIEVMDETTDWEKASPGAYISSSDYIRITGENLVVNDKFNFTFSGDSTSEEIKDPNNTGYWLYDKKDPKECILESVADEKDGITLTYPFVIPGTSN